MSDPDSNIDVCATKDVDEKIEKCRYAYRVAYVHFLISAYINAAEGSDRVYGVEHGGPPRHMGFRRDYYYALLDKMSDVDAMEQICIAERLALGDYKGICSAWGTRKRGSVK